MRLVVLEDNNTYIDKYYLGEPGLSYYIEDGGCRILFDTGYSGAYLKNAEDMGIDLGNVEKIVLSHGHDDHTRGLKFFETAKKDIELIAHPDCLNAKEFDDGTYIGIPFSREQLEGKFRLNLSREPMTISENITFLGEIPRVLDFEKAYCIGKTVINGLKTDDYIADDSALVYRTDEGLFVITGCSHSGICNIIEHAKDVCGDTRILGVIGGFHLFADDARLQGTIRYLKEHGIKMLYPCHCVSLRAKIAMARELEINEVGVGLELNI